MPSAPGARRQRWCHGAKTTQQRITRLALGSHVVAGDGLQRGAVVLLLAAGAPRVATHHSDRRPLQERQQSKAGGRWQDIKFTSAQLRGRAMRFCPFF